MKKSIKIVKDGPYQIPEGVPINEESSKVGPEGEPETWKIGKEITKGGCELCRCGESKNKPFCDDSHIKAKFDGQETAVESKFETDIFEGKDLILNDTGDYCSTARFCHRAEGIWNLVENSDAESNKIAIEEACACPSGRLVITDKKTGKEIEPEFEKSVSVTRDSQYGIGGPLWVKGGVEIESAEGKKYKTRNRVALCRCGKSSNKPFCDGTHVQISFDEQ